MYTSRSQNIGLSYGRFACTTIVLTNTEGYLHHVGNVLAYRLDMPPRHDALWPTSGVVVNQYVIGENWVCNHILRFIDANAETSTFGGVSDVARLVAENAITALDLRGLEIPKC